MLEIITLAVLAIALITKWATGKSSQGIVLERAELKNEYSKLRMDYNQLFESRKSSEERSKGLEAEVEELKSALEEAQLDLDEQIERNEGLGG